MIKKHKSTTFISIRVIFAAMGSINFGYALAYYGITQNTIVQILGYQDSKNKSFVDGLINALLPIGGGIGAFYSARLAQQFGIRMSLMLCDIIGILVVISSLFLDYWTITITRLLFGVIVGLNSALVPQYVQQISPLSLSGILGSFCQMSLLFGLTIAFVLQWIFLQDDPIGYVSGQDYGIYGFNSWRVIFAFPALVSFIRLVSFQFVYRDQLPSELMRKNQKDQAENVLSKIYEDQYVEEKIKELEADIQLSGLKKLTFMDLFGRVYRKRMIVGGVLSLLSQWSGINAINFYAVIIFKDVTNGNFILINILTVMDGVVSILASLLSGLVINKYGRRIMFLVGNGLGFFALTILFGLYVILELKIQPFYDEYYQTLQVLIVIFVFVFIFSFSMSLGPVFWIYIAEILPPNGIGLVVLVNWLSLAMLAQFFPIIADKTYVSICFAVFAVVSFFGEIFIFYEVKETLKLNKTQIHNIYSPYHMPGSGVGKEDYATEENQSSLIKLEGY